MIYQFPEKNLFRAREVLDADLDITQPEFADLYVNLDPVRITDRFKNYRKQMKKALNINPEVNVLETLTPDYTKILFSGYRGSGKTTELYKFHKEINHPDRYFSILIDLEKELEMQTFEYEDYFIQLIYRLAQEINARNILESTEPLDEIIRDWLSETEIEKEITKQAEIKGEAEVSTGLSLLNFFKTKFNLKTTLSANNKTAKIIRQKVKENINDYIRKLNNAFLDIRVEINRAEQGRDILFIVDGFEKAPLEMYEKIFINDSHIIRSIDANIITGLPIHAHFKAEFNFAGEFFENFHLPVTKVTDESIELLSEIIKRRISADTFFESDDVLKYLVRKSGGLIRQLLRLVNFSLLYMENDKLSTHEAKTIMSEYGKRMFERLNPEQVEILGKIKNDSDMKKHPADEKLGMLIFNLFIIRYNGSYRINPVLDEFIE